MESACGMNEINHWQEQEGQTKSSDVYPKSEICISAFLQP